MRHGLVGFHQLGDGRGPHRERLKRWLPAPEAQEPRRVRKHAGRISRLVQHRQDHAAIGRYAERFRLRRAPVDGLGAGVAGGYGQKAEDERQRDVGEGGAGLAVADEVQGLQAEG